MKRDMNLVRALLLVTEEHEESALQHGEVQPALREKFPELNPSPDQIVEHVQLMQEGGLVDTHIERTMQAKFFTSIRLTWQGQEFVADIRNEAVWKTLLDKYGNVSFQVIKGVLPEIVKRVLGGE